MPKHKRISVIVQRIYRRRMGICTLQGFSTRWYVFGTSSMVQTTVTATATACTVSFSDVPLDSTFYSYIQYLACKGIISGYSDGTFRPGNSVTQEQIAKIVSNAGGYSGPEQGCTPATRELAHPLRSMSPHCHSHLLYKRYVMVGMRA